MTEFEEDKLVCYGCAHSAASVPYPGCPSGEWACGSCLRSLNHYNEPFLPDVAVKDNYIPLDRYTQECAVCDTVARYAGHICSTCWSEVNDAKNTEI